MIVFIKRGYSTNDFISLTDMAYLLPVEIDKELLFFFLFVFILSGSWFLRETDFVDSVLLYKTHKDKSSFRWTLD